MDYVGMDLHEWDENDVGGAECGLEKAAVFENVFAGIPAGKAEVENLLAVEIADAAGSCAEAMDEPGEFQERLKLENTEVASAGESPRGRNGLRR